MTGISRNTTCASCTEFPRAALETGDKAVCTGLEEERGFDYPACPLHTEARGEDFKARRILVQKLRNEQ